MYSMILIDDEIWALKGLQNIINWQQEGFEVIAVCPDSIRAMEMIQMHKPDVVFTDIRMDDISGIEILKQARLQNIHSEFVIVSAYSDFEAAREALHYGAFHYLLKPLDRNKVVSLIKRLYEHLNHKVLQGGAEYLDVKGLADEPVKDWIIKAAIKPHCYAIITDKQNYKWNLEKEDVACKPAVLSNGCKLYLVASDKRLEPDFERIRKSGCKDGVNLGISCVRTNFNDFKSMFEEACFSLLMGEDFCDNQNVSDAQRFIMANYMNRITLKDISNKLFLSDTYICEIFKRHTGSTISSYIAEVRLRKAIELFSKTELTLQEIAQRVGYYNYAYFGRVFKQSYGKSPEKYRMCMGNA